MSFVLANAPVFFQQALGIVPTKCYWEMCFVYIDDSFLYSSTIKKYIGHLDKIFNRLKHVDILLNLKICKSFTETVKYRGYITKSERLKIDQSHPALLGAVLPATFRLERHSFLRYETPINIWRQRCSHKQALQKLLQKHNSEDFTHIEVELQVFRELVDIILFSPALTFLKKALSYLVDADASVSELYCSLLQTFQEEDQLTDEYLFQFIPIYSRRSKIIQLRKRNVSRFDGRLRPSTHTFPTKLVSSIRIISL